jgi:hypothetical protein
VTVGVIDRFEVIEIEEENGSGGLGAVVALSRVQSASKGLEFRGRDSHSQDPSFVSPLPFRPYGNLAVLHATSQGITRCPISLERVRPYDGR